MNIIEYNKECLTTTMLKNTNIVFIPRMFFRFSIRCVRNYFYMKRLAKSRVGHRVSKSRFIIKLFFGSTDNRLILMPVLGYFYLGREFNKSEEPIFKVNNSKTKMSNELITSHNTDGSNTLYAVISFDEDNICEVINSLYDTLFLYLKENEIEVSGINE